jgi:class 3 adenylate cyclase
MQRRLAAILAADVVGFSALMERDEEATYAAVARLRREVVEPRLAEHQGPASVLRCVAEEDGAKPVDKALSRVALWALARDSRGQNQA